MRRRAFLKASALCLSTFLLPFSARGAEALAYASVVRKADGSFAAAVLDQDFQLVFEARLEARGHDIALSPDGQLAVVFARRPGLFALVLDLHMRKPRLSFAPPPDRHFYGHGVFSPDGRLLYATENDFDAERGVIGVYDVGQGFLRLGELPSHGIGPHEILLAPDGQTLVVANGGIVTHPDLARQKLNLASMEPSLAYIDAETGDLLEKHELPEELRQLSLRHMSLAANGEVWFGCQYEGAATDEVPLVGRHRRGKDLDLLSASSGPHASLKQYVGSVAAIAAGGRIATSSPRGGVVLIWDAISGELVESIRQADVCGIAPGGAGLVLSSGEGLFGQPHRLASHRGLAWDNHILAL